MTRRLLFIFISVPLAIVLVMLSVANRQPVRFSLDPFNAENPALAVEWPFFTYFFAALIVGLVAGSAITWWRQGVYRRNARETRAEAMKWQREAEDHRKRADELASQIMASAAHSGAARLNSPDRAA